MINGRIHNLKCKRSTSGCKDKGIEFDAIVFSFFIFYLRQPCCWLKHGWSISLYLKLIQKRKNMKSSIKGHIHYTSIFNIYIYIQGHARCKILQILIQVFILIACLKLLSKIKNENVKVRICKIWKITYNIGWKITYRK